MKAAILFIASLFANTLHAQYPQVKVNTTQINVISRENIVSDIDAYIKLISKNHIQPFSNVKRSDFVDRLQHLKDSADRYDIDELMVRWMSINALIQDEHTNIVFEARDVFPLQAYWFQEGIYITGADEEHEALLFSRVIAVNGLPVDSVVKKLGTLITNSNLPTLKLEVTVSLFDPFIIHGLGIAPQRTGIKYTIINERGDTSDITPVAVDRRNLKWIYNNPVLRYSKQKTFWFEYFDTGNYIYFRYASCYDNKKNPFKPVREELEKVIEEKKPGKIIIDMRDNRGGRPTLLQPFIDYLATSDLNKKGRIFVLTGRKTFSSAIMNSAELRRSSFAELVGEETSGSTAFYAGTKYKALPATKLMIQYSTRYWATDEKNEGPLKPDVYIPETFYYYSQKIDSALNYAISR